MNTNLEQVLTETIVSSKKAVVESVEWALKQAPDICDQYLRYEMISSTINAAILTIIGIALVVCFVKFWRFSKSLNEYDQTPSRIVASFVAAGLMTLVSFGWQNNVHRVIKIHVAPKVYLVEFATKLIK